MGTIVKLRKKAISGQRQSLYLDFYPPITNPETGKPTRREFLKLYVFDKPKTEIDKEVNRETKLLAENIRAKRQIEIQADNYGFLNTKQRDETDFILFFQKIAEGKTGNTKKSWNSSFKYFKTFAGCNLTMQKLNQTFCNDFKNFLLNAKRQNTKSDIRITQGSARTYFTKFKAVLKQAYKKGLIEKDLSPLIEGISEPEGQREYLTLEELQKLLNTHFSYTALKDSAIFSALTGLRFSDIEKLTWSEVKCNEQEGSFLKFKQKKTKGTEVLPINKQAFLLMGERKEPNAKVFEGLIYSAYNNLLLKQWVLKAGINKDITFHCFRHTFATLQLTYGTDIYTVSKLLGHRDLKTTQIYAKIVDKEKRKAVDKINLEM